MGTFLITTAIITLLGYDLFLSMMIATKEKVSVYGFVLILLSLIPIINIIIYGLYISMLLDVDNYDMLKKVKRVKSLHGFIINKIW